MAWWLKNRRFVSRRWPDDASPRVAG